MFPVVEKIGSSVMLWLLKTRHHGGATDGNTDLSLGLSKRVVRLSGAGEFHPRALPEPDVNVSIHPAPIIPSP
jgi:hypothetical protein